MTNDNQHSTMAIVALQAKRDNRKEQAKKLYDSGLEAADIATALGISRRTANR